MAVKMSGRICDDDDRDDLDELDDEQLEGDEEEDQDEDQEDGDEDSEEDAEEEQKSNNDAFKIADPAAERSKSIVDVILSDLADAEAECADAERKVTRCKADLRAAKGEYDAAVEALRSLCKAVREDESKPLMPAFMAAEEKAATEGAAAEPEAAAEPSDSWRDAPIGDLAIPDGLIEKLFEAGIDTVGELEELRAEISQGKSKWPKGIGPAKVTTIEDAVLQWLAVNQQ